MCAGLGPAQDQLARETTNVKNAYPSFPNWQLLEPCLSEEFRGGGLEHLGHSLHVQQGDVALASLDLAHVRAVNPGKIC